MTLKEQWALRILQGTMVWDLSAHRCLGCGARTRTKLIQTRARGYRPTRLYLCLECGHVWRAHGGRR